MHILSANKQKFYFISLFALCIVSHDKNYYEGTISSMNFFCNCLAQLFCSNVFLRIYISRLANAQTIDAQASGTKRINQLRLIRRFADKKKPAQHKKKSQIVSRLIFIRAPCSSLRICALCIYMRARAQSPYLAWAHIMLMANKNSGCKVTHLRPARRSLRVAWNNSLAQVPRRCGDPRKWKVLYMKY